MSDWPPESGSRISTSVVATATASGSTNTKGSYAVLAVATGFFSPLLVIVINFNTEAAYLVDIAFGSAGATDQGLGAQTVSNIGIFNTFTQVTGRMQFQTAVSPTATLTATGDQLTTTDTISM